MSAFLILRGDGRALGTIDAESASDAAQRAFAMHGPPVRIAATSRYPMSTVAAMAMEYRANAAEMRTMREMGYA